MVTLLHSWRLAAPAWDQAPARALLLSSRDREAAWALLRFADPGTGSAVGKQVPTLTADDPGVQSKHSLLHSGKFRNLGAGYPPDPCEGPTKLIHGEWATEAHR